MLLAVAYGAARVQPHHMEPGVGERDVLHHRSRSDGAVRPPVDVEYERASAARAPSPQEPSVDCRLPGGRRHPDGFRRPVERCEPFRVVPRDRPKPASLDFIGFSSSAVHRGDRDEPTRLGDERGARDRLIDEPIDRAIQAESPRRRDATVGDDRREVFVVKPNDRRIIASTDKLAEPVGHGGTVEVRAEPACCSAVRDPELNVLPRRKPRRERGERDAAVSPGDRYHRAVEVDERPGSAPIGGDRPRLL